VRGARFLWLAAGSPTPVETDGSPIRTRDLPAGTVCASCGEPASYSLKDAISDSFTTVKNASRAWAFGGTGICAACLWCCKAIALRCGLSFARVADDHGPGGIWFVPMRPIPGWVPFPLAGGMLTTRPDPLAALLTPPPAPFVACLPLYGVDHGGEANAERALLGAMPREESWEAVRFYVNAETTKLLPYAPGADAKARGKAVAQALAERAAPWLPADRTPQWEAFLAITSHYVLTPWWRMATDPLIKLQSKHTALYARVSNSRMRYHLQVDDASDVMVDVPIWRAMREVCESLLVDMRAGGVGATDARTALLTLRQPPRAPLALLASWGSRVEPMRPYASASWWRLFTDLLPIPALTKTPKGPAAL